VKASRAERETVAPVEKTIVLGAHRSLTVMLRAHLDEDCVDILSARHPGEAHGCFGTVKNLRKGAPRCWLVGEGRRFGVDTDDKDGGYAKLLLMAEWLGVLDMADKCEDIRCAARHVWRAHQEVGRVHS
jgi:hypothetical protein